MAKCVRNKGLLPLLQCEGCFLPQFPCKRKCGCVVNSCFCRSPFCGCACLCVGSAYDRLYHHHTLSSVRRSNRFVPCNVWRDSLDLALNGTYDHHRHCFGSVDNVYTQPETIGLLCRYQRRNHVRVCPPPSPYIAVGGICESRDVNNVKINLPNNHNDRTNNGYARKQNGTFYAP